RLNPALTFSKLSFAQEMKAAAHKLCAGCHSSIGGGRAVQTDDDSRFHLNCFRCCACGISLIGSPKVLRLQGRVMCAPCSSRFAPTCAGCSRSIRDKEFLYVAPVFYHADHLTCRGCGDIELASRGFVTFGGSSGPLCVQCGLASRGLVCCGCGCLITRQFLRHGQRNWHIACFKCSRCDQPVQLGTQRLCIDTGQLACQVCCAVAAVSSRLTLAVSMPAVAALLESNPNDAAVAARSPWGQVSGCDLAATCCNGKQQKDQQEQPQQSTIQQQLMVSVLQQRQQQQEQQGQLGQQLTPDEAIPVEKLEQHQQQHQQQQSDQKKGIHVHYQQPQKQQQQKVQQQKQKTVQKQTKK
uniref:LIM zinc-binding domain-containing protein n=2 Tax=Macrostomum lignano TaxID=282301 RepID=A0A1I8J3U8_9PLAT